MRGARDWRLLDGITLEQGIHASREDGTCALEAYTVATGQPFGDRPVDVAETIAAFLRRWNDDLPTDDERNRLLKPLLPHLVGTATTPDDETTRVWLIVDWLARECAPAWLRAAGLADHAEALVRLPPLRDGESAREAQPALMRAEDRARARARARAGGAARDVAMEAVSYAAGSAAWDAAWDAAWEAARSAAWDTAWYAAGEAAWEAAWEAARNVARDARAPTVAALQESAQRLVIRMCAVGRATRRG